MLESQSLVLTSMVGFVALIILIISSDVAVKKLIGLAAYHNLSSTFMGATVISLATSIPEITAHLTASVNMLQGTIDYQTGSAIVLGANIGSDVVQQTLILGLVVMFAGGLQFRRYFIWKSMLPMIGTTIMCIVLGLDREYSRVDGLILFGTFIIYMYYLYVDERRHYKKEDNINPEMVNHIPESRHEVTRDVLIVLASLFLTVASASVVLRITETIVDETGIGGSLIGVITLGVASALPELLTAFSGLRNKEHGISLGALIGSNITNPLVAIGGGALVSTYWVPRPLVAWDLAWETVTGTILWAILWFQKGKLGRRGAIYLMALYFVYILLRIAFFASD